MRRTGSRRTADDNSLPVVDEATSPRKSGLVASSTTGQTSSAACFTAIVLILIAVPTARACIWDVDTLAMEQSQFPSVLELITGKFRRHSQAFYQWRITDRLEKLASAPESHLPALYDDLAVALEKTGNIQRAIEVAIEANERFPNRYQTLANLGTFFIHAGQFDEGLKYIDRAMEINPDAHFGREGYQKLLVQYVQTHAKKIDGQVVLPVNQEEDSDWDKIPPGFARFVLDRRSAVTGRSYEDLTARQAEVTQAITGVLGMMRFGNHRSPILLEALADLLTAGFGFEAPARQLAARALLRAGESVDADALEAYRSRAESLLGIQMNSERRGRLALTAVEIQLKKEVAEADEWFAQIVADEKRWLGESEDPDEEFRIKYYKPAMAKSSPLTAPVQSAPLPEKYPALVFGLPHANPRVVEGSHALTAPEQAAAESSTAPERTPLPTPTPETPDGVPDEQPDDDATGFSAMHVAGSVVLSLVAVLFLKFVRRSD